MSLTIIATAGAPDANSFVTEAEQIAYMAARLNASAWTTTSGSTLTEDEKKALIEATRELSAMRWQGRRVTGTQALSWPRQWAPDPDSPIQDYFDSTALPQRVKDACCELAFQFINAGTTDVAAMDSATAVKRKKVGPLETEYDTFSRPQGARRFPRVWHLIQPLLMSGAGYQSRIVRG